MFDPQLRVDLTAISKVLGMDLKMAYNLLAFDRRGMLKQWGTTNLGPDSRTAYFEMATATAIAVALGIGTSATPVVRGDLLFNLRKLLIQFWDPALESDPDPVLEVGDPREVIFTLKPAVGGPNVPICESSEPSDDLFPQVHLGKAIKAFASAIERIEKTEPHFAARHVLRLGKEAQ